MIGVHHCVSFFALIPLLLAQNISAQQYWSQFANSPAGTTRHDDIYFVDQNTGWATKGSLIYKTENGGTNWFQVLSRPGTHFRSIAFVSPSRGWAGNLGPGAYDGSVTNTNVLYETFDGGTNWSVVPAVNESGMKGFCAMHTLDSTHVYGAGRVRGPAYFCKTADAGTNWIIVNLTAQGVMNGIMDVYFKDRMNGFVVGMDTNSYNSCPADYRGRIARTTDGGQTWTPVVTTALSCCYFWKMSWPSSNTCYVSLQQNGSYSNIVFYKSVDGGNTFSSNGIPLAPLGISSFYLQGIGFVNENEGWIGGNGNSPPYNFLHTLDGGQTWMAAGYTNTANINRIRFFSPVSGVASGSKLHVFHSPLAITSHPRSLTTVAGTNISLSVAAMGDATIAYQWKKDGAIIPNATNAILTLTNVSRADAGFYSALAANSSLSLASSHAEVRVLSSQSFVGIVPISGTVQLAFGNSTDFLLNSNDLSHFSIETSSNLTEWLPFASGLTLTNGRVRFDDLLNQPQRFYRVLEK